MSPPVTPILLPALLLGSEIPNPAEHQDTCVSSSAECCRVVPTLSLGTAENRLLLTKEGKPFSLAPTRMCLFPIAAGLQPDLCSTLVKGSARKEKSIV